MHRWEMYLYHVVDIVYRFFLVNMEPGHSDTLCIMRYWYEKFRTNSSLLFCLVFSGWMRKMFWLFFSLSPGKKKKKKKKKKKNNIVTR